MGKTACPNKNSSFEDSTLNKKVWEELICLLPLHKPTVNNLVTVEHKQSKPAAEQGSPNNFEPQ
jgi:hypothetical protein